MEEKRYEMQVRRKALYKLMDEYVGKSIYLLVKVEPHTTEHAGNSWFEFLGLFAAVFGLALALLEPRLTKQ